MRSMYYRAFRDYAVRPSWLAGAVPWHSDVYGVSCSDAKHLLRDQTKNMFFVYVLKSSITGGLYVGFTENLEKRLAAHNAGDVTSTKAHLPWQRIFYECYIDKGDALRRERYFKTTQGKRALKFMLRKTLGNQ